MKKNIRLVFGNSKFLRAQFSYSFLGNLGLALSITCLTQGQSIVYGAAPESFDRYHSETEVLTESGRIASLAPDRIRHQTIGVSTAGRRISVVIFGLRPDQSMKDKPAIVINATHHGDEKISTEAALEFMETLAEKTQSSGTRELLDKFAIHVQPLVNPDGHALGTRHNARNMDINRDYAYPGSPAGKSFQTQEATVVRDYLSQLNIRGALALHAGTDGVLWPWCHTADSPPDAPYLSRLAWKTATALGTNARQSHDDYPSEGEFSDYVYWRHGAPALTIEVANQHAPHPSRIKEITRRSTRAVLSYIREIAKSDAAKDIALNQ